MQNNNGENSLMALLNELVLTAAGNTAPQAMAGITPASVPNSRGLTEVPTPISAQSANPGSANSTTSSLEEELRRLTGQMTLLRQVNELNQDVLNENTKALAQAATNQSQGSSSDVASTAKSIGSFLLGGLGIGSLVSGIASLFGGGEQPTPPPLVKYALPAALQYEGAVMSSGAVSSYDHNDREGIRAVGSSQSAAGQPAPTASQQVVIQVNAMDSKSFLDHSDDIARAVRAAILNSSSLNDVISEM